MKIQFSKVKKTLAILLAVFFVMSLTAASASAGIGDWGVGDDLGIGDWGVGDDWGVGCGGCGGCGDCGGCGGCGGCGWDDGWFGGCGWNGCGGCGCGTSCNDVLIAALINSPFGIGGAGFFDGFDDWF